MRVRMQRWLLALLLPLAAPVCAQITDAELIEQLTARSVDCGNFEQSRWLADFQLQLDSRGQFKRQPDALIWRTAEPVLSEVVLSADNPELPLGYQVILPVFNGLLGGDLDALDNNFSRELSGTKDAWQATLTPHNPQLAAHLTWLRIQGGTQLEQISVQFGDGDRIQIQLTSSPCNEPGATP